MSRRLFFIACWLAGFAMLALETIWIRQVGLVAGRTAVSAATVLAVFFVFAAAGAWTGGWLAARSARPTRVGGGAWLAAGVVAGVGLTVRLPETSAVTAAVLWAGPVAFLWAIGFPCLVEVLATGPNGRTAECGGFYAADLAGSALGVVAGGVWLPVAVGYRAAGLLAGAVLVVAGVMVWMAKANPVAWKRPVTAATPLRPRRKEAWAWAAVAGSGFLSIGAEVLAMQWLLLLVPESVFVVAAVLFAFVVSLAGGAWLASRLRARGWPSAKLLPGALLVSGVLAVVYPFGAWPWIGQQVSLSWATVALVPLVVCLGMVFPLAWEQAAVAMRHQGAALGQLIWVNKLACAAGAVVVPLALVPWLGPVRAAWVVGAGYFLLAGRWGWLGLAPVALGLWWAPVPVRLWPGEHLRAVAYDAQGVVATVEDAQGSRHMVLNQFYTLNGTGRALLAQRQQAWLPLTLAERTDRVLFIGMGAGISANAVLDFPVRELVAVEVLPAVARTARTEFAAWNGRLFNDARARVVVGDGRRVARSGQWDVVIVDLLWPAADGTGHLYSRDFFREVRDRLAPGGLLCVWLPMHQFDAATAGCVCRTFAEVFPQAVAIRGSFDPLSPIVGLVGSQQPVAWTLKQAIPASPLLRSAAHLPLALVGDLHATAAFASAPVTTDDRPVATFLAATARERLRGMRWLEWCSAQFPSATHAATLAGQNYFAAAVLRVPWPEPREQEARLERAAFHLDRARQWWPEAVLTVEDLGQ